MVRFNSPKSYVLPALLPSRSTLLLDLIGEQTEMDIDDPHPGMPDPKPPHRILSSSGRWKSVEVITGKGIHSEDSHADLKILVIGAGSEIEVEHTHT